MTQVQPLPKPKKRKKSPRRNYLKQCDDIFARLVRSRGVCQIKTDTDCNGYLQCCHGFSRRYKAVRCEFWNTFAGCARHHQWWTAHPEEWTDFLKEQWGADYETRRHLAMNGELPDWQCRLAELKAIR